jgi:hypothetical protein
MILPQNKYSKLFWIKHKFKLIQGKLSVLICENPLQKNFMN